MENSPRGLTLLDPDHRVVVTGEEHHQAALARYAPHRDGRPRRVAVELRFARSRIEVLLDGGRVGELTALMSQRYRPHLDAVLRDGGRPGCVALVVDGRRGLVEMELRLPEPDAAPPRVPGAPSPRPAPGGRRGRRDPFGPPRGPSPRLPRGVRPWLVGGGVVLVLAVAAGIGSRPGPEVPVVAASPAATTSRTAPPPTVAPSTVAPTSAAPVPSEVPDIPDVTDAPVVVPPAATRAPEPAPERRAEPEAAGGSDCHPSYSGCLPVTDDLNCPDVAGPVQVLGPDVYRLDDNNDGVGCE